MPAARAAGAISRSPWTVPDASVCPDCAPKYAGRNWKVCPICGKLFASPASTNTVTCSKECSAEWKK